MSEDCCSHDAAKSDHHNSMHHHEKAHSDMKEKSFVATYQPLFTIVGLILLASVLSAYGSRGIDSEAAMTNFMAGFFFVFAGFKLLDIRGFAEGYSTYDLLAQWFKGYGFVYPFIELALGIGYIMTPDSRLLHVITAIVMAYGGLGVAITLAQGKKFQCACLGTAINVPLTKVTLVEDFGMAAMAVWLLLGA